MEEKEKIRYKTRPIRMDDRTWKLLKEKKTISGKTWNRYIYQLLESKSIIRPLKK